MQIKVSAGDLGRSDIFSCSGISLPKKVKVVHFRTTKDRALFAKEYTSTRKSQGNRDSCVWSVGLCRESWSRAQRDLGGGPRWEICQHQAEGRRDTAYAERGDVKKGPSGVFKVLTGESASYKHPLGLGWEGSLWRCQSPESEVPFLLPLFPSPFSAVLWSKTKAWWVQ